MLKKILYLVMVVVIITGAAYSYKKVEFGRKIGMLFQTAFRDSNIMGGPGGRPPIGGNMEGRQPTVMRPGGEGDQVLLRKEGFRGRPPIERNAEGAPRPDFQSERGPGARPPGDTRMGEGPGGVISLRNVIPYTFILAFFIMITRFFEVFIRRMFYRKP